jgi:hypothetical protein
MGFWMGLKKESKAKTRHKDGLPGKPAPLLAHSEIGGMPGKRH